MAVGCLDLPCTEDLFALKFTDNPGIFIDFYENLGK